MTDSPGGLLRQSLGQRDGSAGCPLPSGQVYVAFSGGSDSTALLLAASRLDLPQPVIAVHVNHGVHPESNRWSLHCQSIAKTLGVRCRTFDVPGSLLSGRSDEGTLRKARYQLLEPLLKPGDFLLTAHHLEDVAESVLLAALRGGSCHELAGISAQRPLGQGMLCRPWLTLEKSRLTDLLTEVTLSIIEDPSNNDPKIRRSFIRQQVLPRVRKSWPNATALLAATATRQASAATALNELLDQHLSTENDEVLESARLDSLSEPTQVLLVQRWLSRHQLPLPTSKNIVQLLKQRKQSAHGRLPQLQLSGGSVRCYRRNLYLVTSNAVPGGNDPAPFQTNWDCVEPLNLPGGLTITCSTPERFGTLKVQMGPRQQTVQRAGEEGHRQLRKLYQSLGIPPWVRSQTPLMFEATQLIQIGHYWRAQLPKLRDNPLQVRAGQ